jgi:threonylcarbamoyladenosine tRNA methylthiotransferase MtaB
VNGIRTLARTGYRETVLTGIHLGAYGLDLVPAVTISDLLSRVSSDDSLAGIRLRLSSIEPNEISGELIDLLSRSDRVCPHLHIPLQSGDQEILKKMNRCYTPDFFRQVVKRLAASIPGVNIGVDVIAGYPGETEAHFQNTLRFIQALPIAYLHVFPYSRRPGTPAAATENQISESVKKQRTALLREESLVKKQLFYAGFSSKTLPVLIEAKSDPESGLLKGFSRNYIPVLVAGGKELIGQEISVRVTEVKGNRVYGEKV